jgi:hypothetical protein
MTRAGWMVWDTKKKWFAGWFVYKTKKEAMHECWNPHRNRIPIRVSFTFKKPEIHI